MSDDDFMQQSDDEEYVTYPPSHPPPPLISTFHHLISAVTDTRVRYDFEYEEDDEANEGDVDIENSYYNAKQLKATEPKEAIEHFLAIPGLEDEKSEWGFKGLKQAIKVEFKLGLYEDVRFRCTRLSPNNERLFIFLQSLMPVFLGRFLGHQALR